MAHFLLLRDTDFENLSRIANKCGTDLSAMDQDKRIMTKKAKERRNNNDES